MLLIGEGLADMVPDDLRAERLADERRPLGQVPGPGLGLAGGDHDRDVRPALGRLARQVEAVRVPRHVHVGEEQLHGLVALFEHVQSLGDVHSLKHAETRILKDAGGLNENQGVVIDDESVGRVALGIVDHLSEMEFEREGCPTTYS